MKTILVVGPDAYPGTPVGGGSAGVNALSTWSALSRVSLRRLAAVPAVLYDRGLPTMTGVTISTAYTTAASGGQAGVTLETFANTDLQGEPASKVVVSHIILDGMSIKSIIDNLEAVMALIFDAPKKAVSHRFTGYYTAQSDGKYIVALRGRWGRQWQPRLPGRQAGDRQLEDRSCLSASAASTPLTRVPQGRCRGD